MEDLLQGAEVISLFCRININTKRDLPIRASEMGLLIFLVKSEEPITSLQAAEFFRVSKPMVAAMVNSLEKKGYLTRGSYKNDRRRFTLLPTDKAVMLVEETWCKYYKTIEALQKGLGKEDFGHLIELIDRANAIILEERE